MSTISKARKLVMAIGVIVAFLAPTLVLAQSAASIRP